MLDNSCGKASGFNCVLLGTDHQNFCDVPLLASAQLLAKPSSIGPNVDAYQISLCLELLIVSYFSLLAYNNNTKNSTNNNENIHTKEINNELNDIINKSNINNNEKLNLLLNKLEDIILPEKLQTDRQNQKQTKIFPNYIMKYLRNNLVTAIDLPHMTNNLYYEKVLNRKSYQMLQITINDENTSEKDVIV